MDATVVRSLVDLRDRTLQKARIAFNNRLKAIERGDDKASPETTELLKRWYERFEELEAQADEDLCKLVEGEEIVQQLDALKGIGLTLAAKLVSMIDIHRAETVSDLWRYAGYAVIDGEREKPTAGEKLHYNKRLKVTCFLIASSFLRASSPYRAIYDDARMYYDSNRPDWTKLHKHYAAMRKMIKVFLQHLWLRWRQIEGLPTNSPYIFNDPNHTRYITPEECGWPPVE